MRAVRGKETRVTVAGWPVCSEVECLFPKVNAFVYE
jgi:hypothetical protein